MPGLFKTSNLALNENTFDGRVAVAGEAMTLQGTVNKTGVLLLCVVITSAWTWGIAHSQASEAALPWMMGGLIGGLVFALATIFKKEWSPITAPVYALCGGLCALGHRGGYRLVPIYMEFWQGHEDRLHDRIVFAKIDAEGRMPNEYAQKADIDGWCYYRIAP